MAAAFVPPTIARLAAPAAESIAARRAPCPPAGPAARSAVAASAFLPTTTPLSRAAARGAVVWAPNTAPTMRTTLYGTPDTAQPPPFASLFEADGRGGDAPPPPTVYTNDSVAVSLVDEVAATPTDRPVILLWLRHYGCTLCKKAAAEASAAFGGDNGPASPLLIAIGCGVPEQAAAFQAEIDFRGTLYSDPRRNTYEALRFKSGVASMLTLSALGKVLSSFASGYSQNWGVKTKAPLQQGGVVVAGGGGGGVTLLHREGYAGDHVALDAVGAAVERAGGRVPAGKVPA